MNARWLWALVPLALTGCAPLGIGGGGAATSGAEFLDPAVRASQERACAAAVAAYLNVAEGAVQVRRTSSDPQNLSVVDATVGAATGYCRVSVEGEVVELVI
jgi:hypothetical protein